MLSAMPACSCSAQLSPADWAGHQRRYHTAKPAYSCPDCDFASQSLPDTIGHCSLEGHSLAGVKLSSYDTLAWIFTVAKNEVDSGSRSPAQEPIELESPSDPTEHRLIMEEAPDSCEAEKEEEEMEEEEEEGEAEVEAQRPEIPRNQNLYSNAAADPKLISDLLVPFQPFQLGSDRPKNALHQSEAQSSECQNCGKFIQLPKGQRHRAVQHVSACLGIRQFACSRCGKLSYRKRNLRRHVAQVCPGAAVVEVEKEKCLAALRESLRRCFPGLRIKVGWRKKNGSVQECFKGPEKESGEDRDATILNSDPESSKELEPEFSEEEEPEEEAISSTKQMSNSPKTKVKTACKGVTLETSAEKPPQPAVSLTCQVCNTVVKATHVSSKSCIALAHVCSCQSIRPYSCSSCGLLTAQKSNIRAHIQRKCPNAVIEIKDKNRKEAAILAGFRQCFPGETFKFTGL